MTQNVILSKFRDYLDVRWQEYIAEINEKYRDVKDDPTRDSIRAQLREEKEYIDGLQETFKRGHCFGLSICHGAMTLIGKQAWWHDALQQLHNWDGKPESLDAPLLLRQGERFITLRQIFEMVMSYTIYSHASPVIEQKNFYPRRVSQQNLLLPPIKSDVDVSALPHYIEIVDANGNVLTVQDNQRVAGHFTKEQFIALLDPKTFRDNIGLIHCQNHTMHINCRADGVWQAYDPNASHESEDKICFSGNQDQIADYIFECMQSQSLAIEIVSFHPQMHIDLTAYEKMMERAPAGLMTVDGLKVMAMETPDLLEQWLRLAQDQDKYPELQEIITRVVRDGNYGGGRNALHFLARYAPYALAQLLELAANNKDDGRLANLISKLIEVKNDDGMTPLHMLSGLSVPAFNALLSLAASKPNGVIVMNALARGMLERVGDHKATMLDLMLLRMPIMSTELLKLACSGPDARPLRVSLVKLLQEKDESKMLRLEFLLNKNPWVLNELSQLINSPDGKALKNLLEGHSAESIKLRSMIANNLAQQDAEGKIVFHALMKQSPAVAMYFVNLVLSDHENDQSLRGVLAAFAASVADETGWQLVSANMDKDQKAAILERMCNCLQYIKTPELIMLTKEVNGALVDDHSAYHGLCRERHGFFRGHYGKTSIWQALIARSQEVLRKRNENVKTPGLVDVLQINVKR